MIADDPFMQAVKGLYGWVPTPSKRKGIGEMILRIAEIDDELERRGVDPLIDEMASLKKSIKEAMIERGIEEAYEETSGYEAVLQQRTSELWSIAELKDLLNPSQLKRYIVVQESIDSSAVAEGLKNGDLSRAELEYKGAVRKVPGQKALYIRRRKSG